MKDKVLILIPARFGSSRFPGKPLAKLNGKTMISLVYHNAHKSGFKTVVVTDDARIEAEVHSFGGEVVRVDDNVLSGTERLALAYQRFFAKQQFELIINVQGDEPLIDQAELKLLAQRHLSSNWDIGTIVKPMHDHVEFNNPNRVKAIYVPETGVCHYFSRASIPFNRDQDGQLLWHLHIGVYSYRPKALIDFCHYPVSTYENIEKLEQLRAIENGLQIGAITTNKNFIGIDTPEDLVKVQGVLNETIN